MLDNYTFEVGGKKKSFDQIKNILNSFVVADDLEIGHKNKIPLWMFGFLYWVCYNEFAKQRLIEMNINAEKIKIYPQAYFWGYDTIYNRKYFRK